MDQTREERMQQRLRGAVRRQIKDVDFGLSIPAATAPAQSSPPASTSYQPGSSPQPSNQLSPSILPPPPPTTSIPESIRPTTSNSANDANTSAKRRKLDSDAPIVSSGRSTRSSRAPRPDIYALVDDEPPEEPALVDTNILPEQLIEAVIAEPIVEENTTILDPSPGLKETPLVNFAEETTIISIDAPADDELTRTNLEDDTISRLQEVGNDSLAQSSEVETPVPARKRKRGTADESQKKTKRPVTVVEDDIDELSPEQPTRHAPKPRVPVRDQIDDEERDPLSDPAEPEEAEGISDQEAAAILSKTRGRKKSIDPTPTSKEDSIETSELPEPKRQRKCQREESNRAEQRQPKKTVSKNIKASRKSGGKAKLRAGSPIPVIIHRLTRPHVYDEDDQDADILNAKISHRKRAGVNPIDVLRQVCQEIVGSALETLKEGHSNCDDPALKREYMIKWRAVEAFGDEVKSRLVEHTINLDNAHSLERRVKDENKKKLSLREDILRIRGEREKVALRMDEIRIRHENETASNRDLNKLNTAVHDIELAVERGKALELDESTEQIPDASSIEILLKRAASEVSKKGDSGGLLRRIREFNGFLERAALALETRRV